jgi:hypothetical protein
MKNMTQKLNGILHKLMWIKKNIDDTLSIHFNNMKQILYPHIISTWVKVFLKIKVYLNKQINICHNLNLYSPNVNENQHYNLWYALMHKYKKLI